MLSQRFLRFFVVLAGACYALVPSNAHAQDAIFADSYELPFNFPANDAEAARFLNQATFGATAADISAVRSQSIAVWLENQLNSGTVTLSRPWLEAYAASLPAGQGLDTGDGSNQAERVQRWYNTAVTAPDQVRQRVAWALSQIVVASDRDMVLRTEPIPMAEWNDIIVRNALGNYRDLMREVTFSPMMGKYLTTLRNRKFELVRSGTAPNFTFSCNATNCIQPDENYAREIMQLFSIGLLVRGNDFYTTFPDPLNPNVGALRTTYGEDDISNLARVFTGLSYRCTQGASVVGGVALSRNCGANDTTACTGTSCRFTAATRLALQATPPGDTVQTSRGIVHPDMYSPMVCYPRYHDTGRDTSGALFENADAGFTLPPGTPLATKTIRLGTSSADRELEIGPVSDSGGTPINCHLTWQAGATALLTPEQQQACINYCEGSINSAVDFLFNHPNTEVMVARQMIQRLVTSNPTREYVSRVASAFADNGQGVRGDMKAVARAVLLDVEARRPFNDPLTSVNFGKPREPLLKQVALWRHFGGVSGDTGVFPATNPQGGAANPFAGQPRLRRWGSSTPEAFFQQRPLGAPSVFNFYEPDYQAPGLVAAAGLFSPELQIVHEVTAVESANELLARICAGTSNNDCRTSPVLGAPGSAGTPNDRAYFPSAAIDAIPAVVQLNSGSPAVPVQDDVALIEFFNARMLGGTMSGTIPANPTCPSATGTGMKGLLLNLLRCSGGLNASLNGGAQGTTGGNQAERERRKALYVMHLIAISPEYNTQR